MKVIALTGEKQACGRLLETLAHQRSVATIACDKDTEHIFASTASKPILRITSPSSYSVHLLASSSDIIEALDRLAKQGDSDFAVVIGDALAAELASVHEVYKARLEASANINTHVESLVALSEWVTLGTLVQAARRHPDINKAGAILTFTGTVRGEAVALEFDIYDGQAQQRINSIVRDLVDLEGIVDAKIHHKAGCIKRGGDIVYIVVAAAHRHEGFKALRDAIERLKEEVPIWKKELTEHSAKWVDAR